MGIQSRYSEDTVGYRRRFMRTKRHCHLEFDKIIFDRVSKDWLLFSFPMFKPQLKSNTCFHRY